MNKTASRIILKIKYKTSQLVNNFTIQSAKPLNIFAKLSSADISKNNITKITGIDIITAFIILFVNSILLLLFPVVFIESFIIDNDFPTNSSGPIITLNIFVKNNEYLNLSLKLQIIIAANNDNITNMFNMLNKWLLKNKYVLHNSNIGIDKMYAFLFFIFPIFSNTFISENINGTANNITDIPYTLSKK